MRAGGDASEYDAQLQCKTWSGLRRAGAAEIIWLCTREENCLVPGRGRALFLPTGAAHGSMISSRAFSSLLQHPTDRPTEGRPSRGRGGINDTTTRCASRTLSQNSVWLGRKKIGLCSWLSNVEPHRVKCPCNEALLACRHTHYIWNHSSVAPSMRQMPRECSARVAWPLVPGRSPWWWLWEQGLRRQCQIVAAGPVDLCYLVRCLILASVAIDVRIQEWNIYLRFGQRDEANGRGKSKVRRH